MFRLGLFVETILPLLDKTVEKGRNVQWPEPKSKGHPWITHTHTHRESIKSHNASS